MTGLLLSALLCGLGGAATTSTSPKAPSVASRYAFEPSGSTVAQGTLREALTVTAPATTVCDASKSPTCWTTPANVPAIGPDGALVYGSYVQALPYSEAIGSWSGANTSMTATIGPNGENTATVLAAVYSASATNANQSFTATAAQWTCHGWLRAGTVSTAQVGILQSGWPASAPSIISGPGSISGSGLVSISGLASTWTHVKLTTTGSLTAASASLYLYPHTSSGGAIVAGDSIGAAMWNCHAGTVAMPYAKTTSSPLSVAATKFETPIPPQSRWAVYVANGTRSTLDVSALASPLTIGPGQALNVTGALKSLLFCYSPLAEECL